jgi:diphthamide biosynthesis methyltransferase
MAIKSNMESELHTLVLLDIRAHEDQLYDCKSGLEYLIKVESELGENVA